MDKLLQPNIAHAPAYSLSSRSYIKPLSSVPSPLEYQKVNIWRPSTGYKLPRNFCPQKTVVQEQLSFQSKPRITIDETPGPSSYYVDLYGPKIKSKTTRKQSNYNQQELGRKLNLNVEEQYKPRNKILMSSQKTSKPNINYYDQWATGKEWMATIRAMPFK
ncbi:hypothetical protein SS50377_24713 [Spironucleus salmonicida]|uniref:Uncharacterized protein n=1 Tax=Spironucleus salmonicida TaxID=348837 RepID=V6LUW2_9EUKA|nr:hypothetical protein SS50377_24713 [Spironucleus salmonicida]|eukprot:EST44594.1 Hypothetical protein SS50377_15599 [Spironucleus salmonicida]